MLRSDMIWKESIQDCYNSKCIVILEVLHKNLLNIISVKNQVRIKLFRLCFSI